ncbi:MAG: sensor histidine kinase [Nitriliruptorales bacterium]|nr:sensor histidine kinase [Nitriliruptorales bacterium]
MIAQRIEAAFDRLYHRLGARYLTVMRYVVLVPIYLAVAFFAVVFLSYLDPTAEQVARAMVVGHVLLILVVVVHMAPGGKKLTAPVDRWLAEGRPDELAMEAWEAARVITSKGFWLALRSGILVYVLSMAYSAVEFSFSLLDLAVITQGFLLAVVGIVAVVWPFTEMYHRPVRRDLARRLGDDLPEVTVQFPIGGRLLLSGAAIGLMTGAVIAFAARFNEDLPSLGRLGVLVVIVGLTISALPIFLLSRSLLAPVEDLLDATQRVAAGDLSARVDVTTNDEVGVLAHSFNRMVDELEEAVAEVRASRARIVAASDAERRRVERNIHDGAQQQLTALGIQLNLLRELVTDRPDVLEALGAAIRNLRLSLDELRELARGLHPSILTTDGLGPALAQLADRSSVPVVIDVSDERLDEGLESTAYFVVSEALANVTKYAQASSVSISMLRDDGTVVLEVVDDGVGGARPEPGSGLAGLVDRVEAVGGQLHIDSPAGSGTTIRAILPG